MKYQVQENCLTIFLPHELDHHNAEEIRRESDHLIIRNHIRYIIFDFAETDFMDSSGIGMIMGRYRQIYMLGGEICAAHANERVKKNFNHVRCDKNNGNHRGGSVNGSHE